MMSMEMIGSTPTTSITDLKANPMNVIEKSKELNHAVYLLNRNKPVAVVMDKEKYEQMTELIERLEDQVLYAETEKRLEYIKRNPDIETYTVEEVIGRPLSEVDYDPEDDEWE
ncbi:type II toxin-antitoxin system Phd/YefM family antitoxin [Alkalibacterium kapii]|uniref:Antitoxin n=1 Tax=Alkalibacterium kapii TaxID=426704 RepID=A0A511ASR2_9LACT|nr:type II toxin-antitoxin system Phd/YefM family antitoxin [Alkalibacterium kapii]GEK91240.1 hypothetical protein AKA01nite_08620 [Alkalibacterium kapii]